MTEVTTSQIRRRRVVFVLATDAFVRNYVGTGVLDHLDTEFDVGVVVSDHLIDHPLIVSRRTATRSFAVAATPSRRHYLLFNVLMWHHRRRSTSFRFRSRRSLGFQEIRFLRSPRSRGRRMATLRVLLRDHLLKPGVWATLILGSRPLAPPFVRVFTRWALPVNEELVRVIAALSPDILVFPSSAYDPVGNDVSRTGESQGIPTVFLVDNWDNVSSKSIFWTKPSYLGVWGPQSTEHAVRIQGFDPARVTELGTPRFDHYFTLREEPAPSPVQTPYVLFVGCALPFDEVTALRILDAEIEAEPDHFGGVRVVYRPHPERQRRLVEERFCETEFRHVVLDPQIREMQERGSTLPDLDHYGPLLANARLVVAPLTTMIIEALIFNRPVVALAYDDGIHFTAPANALRSYEHFAGVSDIGMVELCKEERDLGPLVRAALRSPRAMSRERTDRDVGRFLRIDQASYSERLASLLRTVAASGD